MSKQFAEVLLIGLLSRPRVIKTKLGERVFAGLLTTPRSEKETNVDLWHNLAACTQAAADSIRLFKADSRVVRVTGRLSRSTYEQDGVRKTVCEIRVFDPIEPATSLEWQSLVELQGRLKNAPHLQIDPQDPILSESHLEIEVRRNFRSNRTKTGWDKEIVPFEVDFYGPSAQDYTRDLQVNSLVRVIGPLSYRLEQKSRLEQVEIPMVGGLSLLNSAEIERLEAGEKPHEKWESWLNYQSRLLFAV